MTGYQKNRPSGEIHRRVCTTIKQLIIPELTERLVQHYTAAADPQRATGMSAYTRNLFPFLGIGRELRKQLDREIPAPSPSPAAQRGSRFPARMTITQLDPSAVHSRPRAPVNALPSSEPPTASSSCQLADATNAASAKTA
jgi:hypothetical protein